MKIKELLQPAHTNNKAKAGSKKSVLELISRLMAQDLAHLEYEEILDLLVSREKIGSTGIGHGVAIPHSRIDNISEPIGALVSLENPVDFGAIDNKEVDLFFALLIPSQAADKYLEVLAALAKKFGKKEFREKLRQAKDDTELYNLATGSHDNN